jgi:hypothetical protein
MGAINGLNVQVPEIVAEYLVQGGHAGRVPTVEFTKWFWRDPKVADPRLIVDTPTAVMITLIAGRMHVSSLAEELVNWMCLPGLVGTSVQLRAFDAKGRHSDFELESTTQVEVLGRFLRSYI